MKNRATESKYYETIEYHLAYCELIDVARNRGTTTYQRIAEIMGLPLKGSHMGREVGDLLGAISANEVAHERPMLSAIVLNSQGNLGEGFYYWAKELGRCDPKSTEKECWQNELKQVYEVWKREFHS